MGYSTKDDWLQGPGDLAEADVDVTIGGEAKRVRVRALPAAYSNQASSEALEMKTTARGEQIATVNTGKLEVLQFAHGVIDPRFNVEEAQIVATKYGPAFRKVIEKIDELSGIDKEALEQATATFPSSGASANGSGVGDATPTGDGGSPVHA